ncbi:MAG: hypothetical protein E6H66_16250 [Betaproteobacteria bacterium]|nr:MAG: hypothetical protein E6H66_16250 [Betaproteobacteria bacterium]
MNNRNVFATTLVVVGLVGCGSMPPTHFGPPCTTHECHATVTINGCKIAVDPEVIEVGRDNRNVEIHWDITTPGYAFSGATSKARGGLSQPNSC